ncbi:hypothetical protein TrVE_jg11380 [Triparma verrucosa]|uniref:MORN repeat-containing protein n=1 Tax=Triparma verrucosa TaxID=1606542 RepID=A0A9W7BB90_9STRA|nr:hypothetical protein TrVE_jg11380 [Triparma verrucosa]
MDILGKMGGPMNEAQKKLYKKLLKNIEAKDEEDELAQMTAAKETPAEAYARKLAIERKSEEMMRAKAERRLAKKKEKEEEALRVKIERQKKKEYEERKKKQEEDDKKVKEIEIKTHKFFRLNKFGKGIATGVVYFGDSIRVNESWIPHGFGEYKVNGEILYEGDFSRGQMHGNGIYLFSNHDIWRGTFRFDELHGVGMLEKNNAESGEHEEGRECLFHKNRRICFTDELLPGVHIKLTGKSGTGPAHHSPGATILNRLKKPGHFRVKMDIGGVQSLNLAEDAFQIDTSVARVTLLEDYVPRAGEKGAIRDGTYAEKRYNFNEDIAMPTYTDHGENWYSDKPPPVSDNIDAAEEEKKRKKKEWEARLKAKQDAKDEDEKKEELAKGRAEKAAAEAVAKREAEQAAKELADRKENLLKKREAVEAEMLRRENKANEAMKVNAGEGGKK